MNIIFFGHVGVGFMQFNVDCGTLRSNFEHSVRLIGQMEVSGAETHFTIVHCQIACRIDRIEHYRVHIFIFSDPGS